MLHHQGGKVLVKLTPDQVAAYWDAIRPTIEAALPPIADPESEERMNNILARLLADNMHCWVVQRDGQIFGVGTVIIQEDAATKNRDLLLYSVYASAGATKEDWKDALDTVSRWAISKGCKRFVGYTTNPEMIRILEMLGAEFWTYAMVNFVPKMDKDGG